MKNDIVFIVSLVLTTISLTLFTGFIAWLLSFDRPMSNDTYYMFKALYNDIQKLGQRVFDLELDNYDRRNERP